MKEENKCVDNHGHVYLEGNSKCEKCGKIAGDIHLIPSSHTKKESWEEEFFVAFGELCETHIGGIYEDIKSFVHQTLLKQLEGLEKEVEKIIKEEKWSGAPYALNEVIKLINSKKQ